MADQEAESVSVDKNPSDDQEQIQGSDEAQVHENAERGQESEAAQGHGDAPVIADEKDETDGQVAAQESIEEPKIDTDDKREEDTQNEADVKAAEEENTDEKQETATESEENTTAVPEIETENVAAVSSEQEVAQENIQEQEQVEQEPAEGAAEEEKAPAVETEEGNEEKPVTTDDKQDAPGDSQDVDAVEEGAISKDDNVVEPAEEGDKPTTEEKREKSPDMQQDLQDGGGDDKKDTADKDESEQLDTNTSATENKVSAEGNVKTSEVPATATAFQTLDARHNVNLEATATVKLMLMPSGQVVTLACTLGKTLESLKTHFASELKMSSALIMMTFDGKGMSDSTTLADLGVGPNGTVQLELQSADPVNNPLKSYRPRQEYHMPDVITVRVVTEDCESKDVVVEIERSRTKKPFLGGFRNKNTGVEFHNASAQTLQKPRPLPTAERFCRDTQTCEQKNTRQQTTNTTSTQMTGIGVYVSLAEDKLITPGKYFSADDYWALVLSKVIILQKYYRRWLAKRYVKKLREDRAKRLEWERQEELRKKKEKEDRLKREYARRINPKTKADFDMLLHCLEKWRQEEMERINSTLEGAERKAALCMLLEQETELLSAIERHKNEANLDNRDKRIMQFLEKAAAPKKWQGHDGKLTYMDTPYTIRAKELRDIYNSINMKYLTQDERLDVLLTLKHTVKEHDCKLTQEIIELIDREADLLMRGVKEGNLTGLRKRISTLFLQYIKTPTFNPEAAKLLKVPQDPSTLRKNINYCHSCGNYLPSTEFFITSNSRTVGRCRNCVKVENDGRQREDHSYYRIILKALRKSEEAMQDGSSICYLLQENDLRYLVENIWSNQSMLSAWDDLYDLVLVRWDKHQEWSPWNCILLTHDEAEAHKKLFSLEEGYGHVFIHKVTQKHNFARNYFSRLPGMAEALRQKVGSRDLPSTTTGPSVAGHSVPKAQKV
ncbi:Iq and ubiquitin-like domain-containing protein [Plakobranchus ocellatus]|uniref:Iq and ubiquitin-like domain-containing protein n=1 Tax=Plakobranchus ocellatus TaxID=259542 RepID=A0AAV4B679_9GAST|nr:Iq and ubiquitin-like domain-containing protein [Plakobranchus ocellatus]